jgi:uncharacterized cupin superfamily protein
MERNAKHVLRAAEIEAQKQPYSHPWNPASELHGVQLGRTLGLARTGVNFAVLPPGKESFVYHSHTYEEEWLYILSGRGRAEVGEEVYEVGAGDFLAFPTPSVAHHLTNPFDAALVYLMGGESREFEVADFPRLKRRMVRRGPSIDVYRSEDARPFVVAPEKPVGR